MGQSVISKYILEAEDQTRAALQSAAGNFEEFTGKLLGFASIANLVSVGALAAVTHASMESIDANAKLADALGATTQGLTELQYAANTTGSNTETLNKGLEQMEKMLGDARNGSQKAANEFERLGLSVNQLAQERPEAAFASIADAISKLATGADRAAAANAIFGKAGKELIPMLEQGSAGLAAMAKEADALGLSYSRIDAAKVEAANDAIAKIKAATQGLGNEIAIQLSPIIVAMVAEFETWAKKAGGTQKVVTEGLEVVVKAVAFLADMVRGLEVVWKIVEVAFQGFYIVALNGLALIIEGWQAFPNMVISGINFIIEALNKLHPELHLKEFEKFGGPGSPLDQIKKSAASATDSLLATEKELGDLANKPMPSDQVKKFFADAQTAAQNAATKIASLKGKFSPTGGDADLYAEYLRDYTTEAMKEYQVTLTYLQKGGAAENSAYAERRASLNKALQTGLIDQKTHDTQMEQLERKHQAALVAAAKQGELERSEFVSASWTTQTQIITEELATTTSAVASSNKTMFEINKVASIANAIINTAQGVTKDLAEFPGPIGWAMAAITLLAGLAQVAAIESTSFGGGGGPASVNAGGAPSVDTSSMGQNTSSQNVPQATTYNPGDPTYNGGRATGGGPAVVVQQTTHIHADSSTDMPSLKKALKQHEEQIVNRVSVMMSRRQLGSRR